MVENANGEEYTPGQCYECRNGEHEDYDDDVVMCVITAPGTRPRRGRLCSEHRCMLRDDGYTIKEV
jgi:hypothetical protein